jgi:acylphosphatase
VSGRVQGVSFRYFTFQHAREQGLTGFVRNLRDGRVEVVASGDMVALDCLRTALHQGPPASPVDRVEAMPWSDDETSNSFEIK